MIKAKFIVIICSFFALTSISCSSGYDFYVDANSVQSIEDGSEQYPFKAITGATDYIESNKLKDKTVFVKIGTYMESVMLFQNTKIIGESKSGTIIDADGKDNAVNFFSTKSEIKNLTIKKAEATNIIVDKKSKATIINCDIEEAGKYGIEVKESSATEKYKFTFKDSSVSESGSQGLYISRRKISVTDSEISSNREEGIDLHQGVKGKVSGNHIHGNSESGIESILTGANFTVRRNNIENNHTQGITVQVYSTKRSGKVKIFANTIKGNSHYGIRFANYTHSIGPNKFRIFVAKRVSLSKNTIKDNGKGDLFYQ